MSRKKHAIVRPIQPDVRFQSELVARFVNRLMRRGKKAVAFNIFYGAMDIVKQKTSITDDAEAVEVFEKALENIKPAVEVKSRRVGGTNYQVPIEVRPARRDALAMRWLVSFANNRNEYTAAERLGNEIVDAYNNNGSAVRKREETHRMADANKAFAHYRY